MTQPGWYPDPSDPSRQRYFDGRSWTENYAPFGPPPYAVAATPPPKRKVWPWVVIGAVILLFGGCVSMCASIGSNIDKKAETKSSLTTTAGKSPEATTKPTGKTPAPAGSSVRDGKFEFQVLGAVRDGTSKDDSFGTEHAKGEFFTVRLRVTNIGNEERTFMSANQKLIVNGNEYDATSFMNSGAWIESINPGLGIDGEVTFDIPPGAVPTAIEVHDSMFSGGALLAL